MNGGADHFEHRERFVPAEVLGVGKRPCAEPVDRGLIGHYYDAGHGRDGISPRDRTR